MRSSEQLPLPGAWRPVSDSLVLSAVCAPVLVLFVLRPAVSTLGTPLWAAGAATLVAGLLVLIGAYGIVRSRWRMSGTRAFGIDEKAGTTLVRYSREFLFLRIVALVSAATLFGLLGALTLAFALPAPAVLLFAFGLASLAWLVLWWVRGIRVGTLTVGPEGIALEVNNREQSARWDDALQLIAWDGTRRGGFYRRIDVAAWRVAGWRKPTRHEWLFDPRSGLPSIEIRCDLIDVDPVLLLAWLMFYRDNPGARTELGTPASLARARAADFSY